MKRRIKLVNALDRGGLWHIGDTAYKFFIAIEEVVHQHLVVSAASSFTENTKAKILNPLIYNEDVLFQWCLLTTDTDDVHVKELLEMIVKLYITTRGSSFANSCVELYKKYTKKLYKKAKE